MMGGGTSLSGCLNQRASMQFVHFDFRLWPVRKHLEAIPLSHIPPALFCQGRLDSDVIVESQNR